MVEARLGASACGACNVGDTSGGVRVEGESAVICCWETKASIKCKMAVRAMALAVKKRECGNLVSMSVVEGAWRTGVSWWWREELRPSAPSCHLELQPPSHWGKART